MKYTVEMGSGAVIYMPSFIKIGSGIQKLTGGVCIQTHRQQGNLISLLLLFFKIRKVCYKHVTASVV
jgi:hypothetical protein